MSSLCSVSVKVGTYGDNELMYVCCLLLNTWHFAIFRAAPFPTEVDQLEAVKEVKLKYYQAYNLHTGRNACAHTCVCLGQSVPG